MTTVLHFRSDPGPVKVDDNPRSRVIPETVLTIFPVYLAIGRMCEFHLRSEDQQSIKAWDRPERTFIVTVDSSGFPRR